MAENVSQNQKKLHLSRSIDFMKPSKYSKPSKCENLDDQLDQLGDGEYD